MTSVVGARPSPNERLVPFAVAVAAAVSLLAWAATGRAVAVPLVSVGAVSVAAALIDGQTGRIPNRVVVAGVVALLAGGVLTVLGDGRSPGEMAAAAVDGVLAGGAPFLAIVWFIRPAAVGAGDIKLLAVQGAAVGLVAPLAAVLVLLGGTLGATVFVALRSQRHAPMGPGLAVGFVAAVVAGASANTLLGGVY